MTLNESIPFAVGCQQIEQLMADQHNLADAETALTCRLLIAGCLAAFVLPMLSLAYQPSSAQRFTETKDQPLCAPPQNELPKLDFLLDQQ